MASASDRLSAALEAALANFASVVRRVGWRHRLSDADIDEVLQEVRIRLWHAYASRGEHGGEVPASYVYRTAVSATLDLLRRRRARRAEHHVPLDAPEGERQTSAGGPAGDLEAAELADLVARAIETIPASRRPVVRMYLAGYGREEIAEVLGWTEAKTRNLLYRGLADLRARLTEWGVTAEGER